MNKKMKWSIISISTATALTFGGLVVNNQKIVGNTNSTTESDSIQDNDSNEDEWRTNDYSEENDENNYEQDFDDDDYYSDEDDFNQDSSDQGSSWEQDQFQQAPSNGFEQGHGSSGASR